MFRKNQRYVLGGRDVALEGKWVVPMKHEPLYLDSVATSKPTELAIEAFEDVCKLHWMNPSSTIYSTDSAELLRKAREMIADWICCSPQEVFFTSGSTEAANWVIQTFTPNVGEWWDYCFISDRIEHPCVYSTLQYMRSCGFPLYYADVDRNGLIDVDDLKVYLDYVSQFRSHCLVAIMDSNNELGTIEPTREIADLVHSYGDGFKLLTDMTQSFSQNEDIDVTYRNTDFAFGSAQKFGAPRGCGFLYVRNPDELRPFMYGGHQESGKRAGTENLAGIWSMAVQFSEIASMRMANAKKVWKLRDYLLFHLPDGVKANVEPGVDVLPGVVSLRTQVDANQVITALAMQERPIYLSAGSACSTGENKPSRILKACGYSDEEARHTIRVSLNAEVTVEDIKYFISSLKNCQEMLRN